MSTILEQMEVLPMTISKTEKAQNVAGILFAIPAAVIVLAISMAAFGAVA